MEINLGTLKKVDIRKIWPLEPEFSAWLALPENLKLLNDELHLSMLCEETEAGVGDFSADILAQEDGGTRKIIIENQYGKTDHDHLGKLITYAAGQNASVLIWIVENARDEHRAAIQWLNENTSDNIDAFLVKIEVFKIGDSVPAPKFTILESPNDWLKTTRTTIDYGILTDTKKKQLDWWNKFMDYAMQREKFSRLFNRRKARPQHWFNLPLGSAFYHISLTAKKEPKTLGAEVYIPDNKDLFQHFYAQREAIENELGFKLDWQELPESKASRIAIKHDGDFTDLENATNNFLWYCEKAEAFRKVFPKYIR